MITGRVLKYLGFWVCVALAALSTSSVAMEQDELMERIRYYEDLHGVPLILQAIIEHESGYNPWALNIDGLGLYPESRDQALAMMEMVEENPYLIRIQLPEGNARRMLFPSRSAAEDALNNMSPAERSAVVNDSRVSAPIRRLSAGNIDICAAQINYHWNGQHHFPSKDAVFDVDACLDWAAGFLADLVERHGVVKGVGCYHNCGRKPHQVAARERYLSHVRPIFSRLYRENYEYAAH